MKEDESVFLRCCWNFNINIVSLFHITSALDIFRYYVYIHIFKDFPFSLTLLKFIFVPFLFNWKNFTLVLRSTVSHPLCCMPTCCQCVADGDDDDERRCYNFILLAVKRSILKHWEAIRIIKHTGRDREVLKNMRIIDNDRWMNTHNVTRKTEIWNNDVKVSWKKRWIAQRNRKFCIKTFIAHPSERIISCNEIGTRKSEFCCIKYT